MRILLCRLERERIFIFFSLHLPDLESVNELFPRCESVSVLDCYYYCYYCCDDWYYFHHHCLDSWFLRHCLRFPNYFLTLLASFWLRIYWNFPLRRENTQNYYFSVENKFWKVIAMCSKLFGMSWDNMCNWMSLILFSVWMVRWNKCAEVGYKMKSRCNIYITTNSHKNCDCVEMIIVNTIELIQSKMVWIQMR